MADRFNLTIIIPHYNTPDLLEKLICSIPEQEDIQTIVVDDNSTKENEKYEQIKRNYGYRIEFYQNNTGIQSAGSCRNIGLENAEGKWIIFADADDYFLPNMYDVVQKYFNSDYDIVFFLPTSVFIDTGEKANRHQLYEDRVLNYIKEPNEENTIALKRIQQPWSRIIKRELIKKYDVRFSQVLYSNDMYFSAVSGFYAKKICASKEKIYCITRNRGSLTTHINEEAYDIRVDEHIKTYRFLIEHYGKKMCKKMNVTGAARLYDAIEQNYGIKKCIKVILKFKRNNIPIFSIETFKPMHIYHIIKNKLIDKKYYIYNRKY